jgi:transcriptional regulator with XRE-family HTH domain
MVWHEGDVIRKLRSIAKWTLQDLALASGVTVQTIHGIEKGTTVDPKTSTLDRIAAPFGLTGLELRRAVPPSYPLVITLRDLSTHQLEKDNASLAQLLAHRRKTRRSA